MYQKAKSFRSASDRLQPKLPDDRLRLVEDRRARERNHADGEPRRG